MQKREQLLLIAILISIFAVSGCSDYHFACKGYLGDKLPKDQVAWVVGDVGSMANPPWVMIGYVDGRPLKFYGCKQIMNRNILLLPGKHTLRFNLIIQEGIRADAKDLSLEVEPGHLYMIRYIFTRIKPIRELGVEVIGTWDAWIEDCGHQIEGWSFKPELCVRVPE
ncbi:MAG: hypothetical protein ABSH06_26260 [Thermodesulfobacteriota bacterium]